MDCSSSKVRTIHLSVASSVARLALVFEDLCQPKVQMNSVDLNDPRTAVRGI